MNRSGGGGGAQADLEILTERGADARAMGEMPKGFRTSKDKDKQGFRRAELSRNEGSEGRDREEGAWGHSNKGGRGVLTWSEIFKKSVLHFVENR